jgi:hypothetical protein
MKSHKNIILQLKKLTPLCLITFALGCFAFSAQMQAAVNTPDPGSVGPTNTADGDTALPGATGFYNSAFGFLALLSNGAASFNTGVGAGALFSNTETENTATGAGALFSNTNGGDNTANGAFALFTNTTGDVNTAIGALALLSNTTGGGNTAIGHGALQNNTTGTSNTAVGISALNGNTTGNENIAVGNSAGTAAGLGDGNIFISSIGGPGDSNTIRIGSGLQTATFIDGIAGVAVTGDPVVVNSNGQLGVAPTGSPLSKNELLKQQHLVQELKAITERQAATIALQEKQIEALTTGLQKVSAEVELSKRAPQTVLNNH